MEGLTPRQRQVLDFIHGFIDKHNYSPSFREIQQNFGFSSLGSVYKHIRMLERKGFLSAKKQCSRSLTPITPQDALVPEPKEIELPFVGFIEAGAPIAPFPHIQTIAVPEGLIPLPKQSYALRAQGNTLSQGRISEGDLIIVEGRPHATAGEQVIAQVHGNQTHIGRYYPEGQYTRLEEAVTGETPLVTRSEEIVIQGALVALIRLYK